MKIELSNRTIKNVELFWEQSQREDLNKVFPFQRITLKEAIEQYQESISKNASSFGKVITVDDKYIGDVWVYMIDEVEKSCFLSIVIFDNKYHNKGIAKKSIIEFLSIVKSQYDIDQVFAFTYVSNIPSQKMLEGLYFEIIERFEENGIESFLYMLEI